MKALRHMRESELERLSELVGEIYLAEGKKKQDKAWDAASKAMQKLIEIMMIQNGVEGVNLSD